MDSNFFCNWTLADLFAYQMLFQGVPRDMDFERALNDEIYRRKKEINDKWIEFVTDECERARRDAQAAIPPPPAPPAE